MIKIALILTIVIAVIAAFIWYISTRDTSALILDQEKLTVSINKNLSSLNVEEVEKKSLEFNTLQVKQTILKREDESLIVLEETATDDRYQYNFSTPTSAYMALNAREINIIFQSNNLYFLQAKLQSRKMLNVIARQSDDQSLSMLYGMNSIDFQQIISDLTENETRLENELTPDAITLSDLKNALQTHWSTSLHAIDGLITSSDKE